MTVDPRIPTMPGRSMSGFHRPGRYCLLEDSNKYIPALLSWHTPGVFLEQALLAWPHATRRSCAGGGGAVMMTLAHDRKNTAASCATLLLQPCYSYYHSAKRLLVARRLNSFVVVVVVAVPGYPKARLRCSSAFFVNIILKSKEESVGCETFFFRQPVFCCSAAVFCIYPL